MREIVNFYAAKSCLALNGIQEVSGSIPLISTRYVERLDFFGDQAFLLPQKNIGMMLAASTAVQASSPPTEKGRFHVLKIVKTAFFVARKYVS